MNRPILPEFRPSSIACIFTTHLPETFHSLPNWISRHRHGFRLATVFLPRLPAFDKLLHDLTESLARATLLLWPDWFDGAVKEMGFVQPGETEIADEIFIHRLTRTQHGVNGDWLREAVRCCRQGKPPLPLRFSPTIQMDQLSRCLASTSLILAVALNDTQPSGESLRGFSRAVEWLSQLTGSQVLAILPTELHGRNELDPISFDSLLWEAIDHPAASQESKFVESKHTVCPIVGRPHPGSPGELLLADRLSRDSQLGRLFGFNQWVTTVFDNRFLVDLLWEEGRIVVEIDGYRFHSDRENFNGDRERDYELTLTNYLVLRLPHDLVMEDPDRALLRIRDFVRFRNSHPLTREGSTK